ncbi:macrophage immunometabolism regulator-like isoform X1 [Anguilla rostrata]|uniref:macrophage immunometabolism regulator-like isoform X1 n=2 Tax=Anguilla rostrata TaxID=7938 RepID=UPI0030D24782
MSGRGQYKPTSFILFICNRSFKVMSVKMETDVGGVSRAPMMVLPAAEPLAGLRAEPERPRCSSTPCSPVRSGVAGYQIVHMDCNYLVGFTTGEELLKRAHKRPGVEKAASTAATAAASAVSTATPEAAPNPRAKPLEAALHRASRVYRTKSRHYQPYDIPAVSGHRRRRSATGAGDRHLRPPPPAGGAEPGRAFHGPLPLCLLRGKRPHPKSLDYLNLDKMAALEPADTEVLQYQLQHLTLRGDRMYTRNKT